MVNGDLLSLEKKKKGRKKRGRGKRKGGGGSAEGYCQPHTLGISPPKQRVKQFKVRKRMSLLVVMS